MVGSTVWRLLRNCSEDILYTTNGGIDWVHGEDGNVASNSIYFIDANNGWAVGGWSIGSLQFISQLMGD